MMFYFLRNATVCIQNIILSFITINNANIKRRFIVIELKNTEINILI